MRQMKVIVLIFSVISVGSALPEYPHYSEPINQNGDVPDQGQGGSLQSTSHERSNTKSRTPTKLPNLFPTTTIPPILSTTMPPIVSQLEISDREENNQNPINLDRVPDRHESKEDTNLDGFPNQGEIIQESALAANLTTSVDHSITETNQNAGDIAIDFGERGSPIEIGNKFLTLPRTPEEVRDLKYKDPDLQGHPGLEAVENAIEKKRSHKSAIILLLGLGGAGKSSTMNFIFGRQIAGVDRVAGKPEIVEYTADVPLADLRINNTQLRIIDVPGVGSSEGTDVKIIASLKKYLSDHEELGNNAVPNAVLIFSRFDDNRFQGSSSTFVQMLRNFNMIDASFVPVQEGSNIIFVLTRLLGETKKIARQPAPKLNIFRQTIRNYTTFPNPLILSLAENEAANEELPMLNGSYKLPNKELYPQNLIDRIINISSDPMDKLGFEIFKTAFAARVTLNLTKVNSVEVVENEFSSQISEDQNIAKFPIETSEVSEALKHAYANINPELKKAYPSSLQLLQLAFQTKKIKEKSQIPTRATDVAKFLRASNMNPAMLALFQKTFSIEIPEFESSLVVGYGYDVLRDDVLQSTPFSFEEMKFSKLGFMLPDGVTAESVSEEDNVLNFYKDAKEYMNARIRELSLEVEVNEESYQAEFRSGYNVIDSSSNSPFIQVRSPREVRTFQLTLNERLPFNQNFQDILTDLPPYTVNDRDSVAEWLSILNEYGTHIVGFAYGGGEIETTAEVKGDDLETLRSGNVENLKNTISNLPQNSNYQSAVENDSANLKLSIRLKGGEHKFRNLHLAELPLGELVENVDQWKETLGNEAIMLKTKLQLIPLSDIIKPYNASLAIEMQKAMKDFLAGNLKYVAPPTPPRTEKPTLDAVEEDNEIQALNRTAQDLEERLTIYRREMEESRRRFQDMLTSTTLPPRRNDDVWSTTRKPVEQKRTLIQRAKDFLWRSFDAIPAAYQTARTKILDAIDRIGKSSVSNEELEMDSLKKIVEEARETFPTTKPPRGSNTNTEGQPPSNPWPNLYYRGPGYGYNLIHDMVMPKTPFSLQSYSFTIYPLATSWKTVYIQQTFSSFQSYINWRVHQTTGTKMYIHKSVYQADFLPGYRSEDKHKLVIEQREWSVLFNKLSIQTVSDEFKNRVNSLPYFDDENSPCQSANQWKAFFNEYGTHILKSAYMGGALEFEPFGSTLREMTQCPDLTRVRSYLSSRNIKDLDLDIRAIGGDSSVMYRYPKPTSSDMGQWFTSVSSYTVTLPTDIKLTPIYKVIELVRPEIKRSAISAFNSLFDGRLNPCDEDISCGPTKRSGSKGCICLENEVNVGGECWTRVGKTCSADSWDNCVKNSYCAKARDGGEKGICTTRDSFVETPRGLSFKPFRASCTRLEDCNQYKSVACISGACRCVYVAQTYKFETDGCLSMAGGVCGPLNKFGWTFNLKCKKNLVCDRETATCIYP